jgi:hypothetical protein
MQVKGRCGGKACVGGRPDHVRSVPATGLSPLVRITRQHSSPALPVPPPALVGVYPAPPPSTALALCASTVPAGAHGHSACSGHGASSGQIPSTVLVVLEDPRAARTSPCDTTFQPQSTETQGAIPGRACAPESGPLNQKPEVVRLWQVCAMEPSCERRSAGRRLHPAAMQSPAPALGGAVVCRPCSHAHTRDKTLLDSTLQGVLVW